LVFIGRRSVERYESNGISTSDSDIQAREAAHDLQLHVDQQVQEDGSLSKRLESLQLPTDASEDEDTTGMDTYISEVPGTKKDPTTRQQIVTVVAGSEATAPTQPQGAESDKNTEPRDHLVEPSTGQQLPFNLVLASTRVYGRVKDVEIDAVTSISSTRSWGWSILSGLSLTEISIISVIKLPLYDQELARFYRIASASMTRLSKPEEHISHAIQQTIHLEGRIDDDTLSGKPVDAERYVSPAEKRIKRELLALERDCPSHCWAGPIDEDDLVGSYTMLKTPFTLLSR